jgi:hypothetical protein
VKVRAINLLCAETTIPFRLEGSILRFTIPRVEDYEVAAVIVGSSPS